MSEMRPSTNNTTWLYVISEPGLFTVGFYDPDGKWHTDSDHASRDDAAARVNYLNGCINLYGKAAPW